MIQVTPVTSANLEAEVLKADGPVVIEFWTEGCKPCQRLGQVLRQFSGQLKITTCDVDAEPDLATQFGVMNIPTILFFRDGQLFDRAIGTVNDISEEEVAGICRKILSAGSPA